MQFISHRGLYDDAIPENSLAAFDNAFNNDFDGIELDVRKTKDNKIVIIHDSFISRVSNGFGLVKNLTYKELLQYNFGKNKISRILLLEDVLAHYHHKLFIIELKDKITIEELNLNKNNTYYISSFNYNYIKDIPKSSTYKKGIINYVLNTNIDLKTIDFIMILDSLITDNIYNFYRSLDIEVLVYGVGKKIDLKLSKENREKIKYII